MFQTYYVVHLVFHVEVHTLLDQTIAQKYHFGLELTTAWSAGNTPAICQDPGYRKSVMFLGQCHDEPAN